MRRIVVDSSHIAALGYDLSNQILEVEFKEGQIYQYLEVPLAIFDGFNKADSAGQYFYAYINKQYRYKRVFDDDNSRKLAFVTGNTRKFTYLKTAFEKQGLGIEQLILDTPEIQAREPHHIALAKAKESYRLARHPVVVNDLFWSITALKGFPGGYAKDVDFWFSPQDFLVLLAQRQDRSIACTDTLIYYDGSKHKEFSRTYWGTIADKPYEQGKSLMSLIIPNGQSKTIAQLEAEGVHPFSEDVTNVATIWDEFTKWYALQKRLKRVP